MNECVSVVALCAGGQARPGAPRARGRDALAAARGAAEEAEAAARAAAARDLSSRRQRRCAEAHAHKRSVSVGIVRAADAVALQRTQARHARAHAPRAGVALRGLGPLGGRRVSAARAGRR
jgi:hypothetical protein